MVLSILMQFEIYNLEKKARHKSDLFERETGVEPATLSLGS
jgi:hypothetical protein